MALGVRSKEETVNGWHLMPTGCRNVSGSEGVRMSPDTL